MPTLTSAARPGRCGRELTEGLRTVFADRSLRAVAGAAANLNLFGMLVMASTPPASSASPPVSSGELVGGVAVMLFDVTAAGITLSSVPTELLDRVSSCMAFLTQGVKPLGALAGGVLGTALDLHPALWVAAAGATTTMLWTVFSPLRKHPGLPGGCRPDAHAEGPPT